jgi:sensor histidine kinase YesM
MTVRDEGRGCPGAGRQHDNGIGLRNTEARLKALYAEGHEFSLTNAEGGGAIASIVIPFRPGSLPDGEPGSAHGSKDTSHYC